VITGRKNTRRLKAVYSKCTGRQDGQMSGRKRVIPARQEIKER